MNRFNRIVHWPHKMYRNHRGGVFFNKLRLIIIQILTRFIRWYYHCDIPYSLDVSGCYFCHKGFGVVINPHSVIGRNVVIQHGVTIGEIGDATPIIGDNVYIGAKATITGGITVGSNAKIGAGAVVLRDVPEGCTSVGVPARIIKAKDGQEISKVDFN